MHLPHPRIPPLSDAELTPAQREALAPASYPGTPPLNTFRTFAYAPEALTPPLLPCGEGFGVVGRRPIDRTAIEAPNGDEGRKHARGLRKFALLKAVRLNLQQRGGLTPLTP